MSNGETSTGMEPSIAGLLCYVLGWITGIIFIIIEKQNNFVRFHAMQSIVVFGALTILSILISIIQGIFLTAAAGAGAMALSTIFSLVSLISTIIWIIGLVAWIILMVKAYQGEYFKLPIAGDIAEKQIDKI